MSHWLISRRLRKMAQQGDPDRQFVRALERRLRTETGHTFWWVRGRSWGIGTISVLTLISSTTGAYAYASDTVLPNTPLYGLRVGIEQAEEKVAFTPDQKVNVRVKHLKRRLHESELLADQKKNIPKDKEEAFTVSVKRVMDQAGELPEPRKRVMQEALLNIEKRHNDVLRKERREEKKLERREERERERE